MLCAARHDLARLLPNAGAAVRFNGASCTPEHTVRALLDGWIRCGHPLIVTRQPPGLGDEISLGLALPPAQGKVRLAFRFPRGCVRETSSPPTLASAWQYLPRSWRPKLRALLASREIEAASPRVYGSAAMEVVTRESCLGPTSDLDLRLTPRTWAAAVAVAAALAAIDESIPGPRLDGEIWNPDGVAVAWRELAKNPERVLTKSSTRVDLISSASFARSFASLERVVG